MTRLNCVGLLDIQYRRATNNSGPSILYYFCIYNLFDLVEKTELRERKLTSFSSWHFFKNTRIREKVTTKNPEIVTVNPIVSPNTFLYYWPTSNYRIVTEV